MPRSIINAPYYNLVKDKLLNPINLKYYIDALVDNKFRVDPIFMDDPTPNVFNPNNFKIDTMCHTLYNLKKYIRLSRITNTKAEYNTLYRVLSNNTYNVMDLLISAFTNAYYINYVVAPISKKIAINKIKRNAVYNHGLGLKLAVKAYSKDF